MATAWTYSDYITYESGSSTRLERLRLHIQEVSDRIGGLKRYAVAAFNVEKQDLETYLSKLLDMERGETAIASATGSTGTQTRFGWSRARPIIS